MDSEQISECQTKKSKDSLPLSAGTSKSSELSDDAYQDRLDHHSNKSRISEAFDAEISRIAAQIQQEAAEARFREEYGADLDVEAELAQCRDDIVHWINQWCWTYDPRLANTADGIVTLTGIGHRSSCHSFPHAAMLALSHTPSASVRRLLNLVRFRR